MKNNKKKSGGKIIAIILVLLLLIGAAVSAAIFLGGESEKTPDSPITSDPTGSTTTPGDTNKPDKPSGISPTPHEHIYTSVITAPTCTEQGYTTHTCTCDDSYIDTYIDATGHVWDNGTVTKEATETEEGERTYTCTVCSDTKTETIPTTDHVHKYTAAVTKPTCTDKGYTTHTCTCGDSYTDTETDARGHSYGTWKVTKKATCDKDGTETRTCDGCNKSETRSIKATGHAISSWEVTTEAGCTTAGVETGTCSKCTGTQTRTIKAKGHTYGEWSTTKSPTCDLNGSQTRTCKKCQEAETKSIAATGHKWDDGKITVNPTTCSDVGIKTYTCKNCTATKTERVKGTHSFGEWQWEEYKYEVPLEEPFNSIYGPEIKTSHKKYRVCNKCSYRETVNTPDHNCVGNWAVLTPGENSQWKWREIISETCEGTTYRQECKTCGWSKISIDTQLKKHDFVIIHSVDVKETECTLACKAEVAKCNTCGKQDVAYSVVPYKEYPSVNHPVVGSIAIKAGDAWNPDPYVTNYAFLRENIKTDDKGYLVSFDVHWHDENWNCHRYTIVAANAYDDFKARGYTFKSGIKYCLTYRICYDKYTNTWSLKPDHISASG